MGAARTLDQLAAAGPLGAAQCADVARAAARLVDTSSLERDGTGTARLLWRGEHSEAWLNTWWEARDTGFHDHGGSALGVFVIEGRAANEALTVGATQRPLRGYAAGSGFSFPPAGIHRMEHEAGAVTVHVYAPPLREIGHYELVDGELRRTACSPDDASPPSPTLAAALRG